MMASGKLDKLTDAMGVLGLLVTGALTANFVSMTLPVQIVRDLYDSVSGTIIEGVVIFNADNMLNGIFPKILPLGLTLVVYYLYTKKKWSPLKLMVLILVLAVVLTGLGYATGFYA